ncbi:MAG: alpha/beta fold hydrolase [Acidimicrobiales bacterium]
MSEPLPRPPGGLWGLVSRPSWRELRLRSEGRALEADPIWTGDGVPRGRGRRLVLVPGFLAGDRSLSMLEPWLQRCGWDTRRAPVGRNHRPSEDVLDLLEAWLLDTVALERGPVPVIGHSRGGQEARVLALRHPGAVSLLVTLGAPLQVLYPPHLAVRAPAAALQLAHWARRTRKDLSGHDRFEADRTAPFPSEVPFVSIYSRTDGFLDWRICLDEAADGVEIDCTHLGLAASVPGFRAIATALERLDD